MDLHVFPIPIPPPYRPCLTPGPLTSVPPEPPPQSPSYACFPPVFAHFVASAGCTLPVSFPGKFLFPAGGCSQAFFGSIVPHHCAVRTLRTTQHIDLHLETVMAATSWAKTRMQGSARGPSPLPSVSPQGHRPQPCFRLFLKRLPPPRGCVTGGQVLTKFAASIGSPR